MSQRRYKLHRRQQRSRSPWAALLIPFLAIVITGVVFYFVAKMLGGGVAPAPSPTPLPAQSPTVAITPTPTPEPATPTPEPTPTPQPPTPTPTVAPNVLQVGAEATVNAEAGLRVRSGPGTNFDPVIMLPAGTVVLIIDGPQRADTYTWWQIRFKSPEGEEMEGWVAGDFLDPGAG
jgi:hypothetical protein